MAPPLGRYIGQQTISQFGHPSQQQQQLQHHAQGLAPSALAPPSLGGHPSFGNPNSNLNLFPPTNGASFSGGFPGGGGLGNGAGTSGTGLGSHAAQMGFAHGAALQRQEANESGSHHSSESKNMGKGKIREVWRGNLAQEMAVLRGLVDKYPYIAMVRFQRPPRKAYTAERPLAIHKLTSRWKGY
jgi:CCR4-NOT transcription complex subunit 7/8